MEWRLVFWGWDFLSRVFWGKKPHTRTLLESAFPSQLSFSRDGEFPKSRCFWGKLNHRSRPSTDRWVCAPESEALRVAPKTADAVLFYSQRGDGSLDGHSLHSSCPVLRGEKWAANLWVWNRPRDRLNQAKAKAREGLTVTFTNHRQEAVELYWVDDDVEALQTLLQPGRKIAINTFPTHVFAAKLQGTPDKIGQWTMDKTISKDISV